MMPRAAASALVPLFAWQELQAIEELERERAALIARIEGLPRNSHHPSPDRRAARSAPEPPMTRHALLAKIHIARKQLAMDEPDYRAMVRRVAGADSAAALSEAALARIVAEFIRMGWKATANPAAAGRKSAKPHVRKIFALWGDLARRRLLKDGSRAALVAFVERQTGVSHPDWLTAEQANKVTEGLKAMQARGPRS